jgi:hypothetical protein
VSIDLGRALNRAEELRLVADYRGEALDLGHVAWAVAESAAFVAAVQMRFFPESPVPVPGKA